MSEPRAGYDALVEHFQRPDRRETPEQIAHNAIAVLLAMPVHERMEAMGMKPAPSKATVYRPEGGRLREAYVRAWIRAEDASD